MDRVRSHFGSRMPPALGSIFEPGSFLLLLLLLLGVWVTLIGLSCLLVGNGQDIGLLAQGQGA
eukprot:3777140-Prorocentrum_lima.AAC.1